MDSSPRWGEVGAFESQTMSTISAKSPTSSSADYVRVHELTYQWFGASVTPKTLNDNWTEHSKPGSADPLAEAMHMDYTMDQQLRDIEGPPARPAPASGRSSARAKR